MKFTDMLENEIKAIKENHPNKWTFVREDAHQVIIGVKFKTPDKMHFILPDEQNTKKFLKRLIIMANEKWRFQIGREFFPDPLDNLRPLIDEGEFKVE